MEMCSGLVQPGGLGEHQGLCVQAQEATGQAEEGDLDQVWVLAISTQAP